MSIGQAWTIAAIFVAFLVLGMLSFIGSAHANPFYVSSKAQSGGTASSISASSTRASIPVGLGTTTIVYDSYEMFGTIQPNQGNLTIPDTVSLALNGTGSSTLTVVNVACEYSDNWNGTNGDWYQDEFLAATSTGVLSITTPVSRNFTVSSSTIGGVALGTSGSNINFQKMMQCPINTRFVRAVITTTGANALLWAQWIPKKQRNSGN